MDIVRDDEVMGPVDDLLVRLVRRLGTERRIPDQTFKHDRAQGPPIALVSVSLLQENLGRNIIGRPDCRICLQKDEKNSDQNFIPGEWGSAHEFSTVSFPGCDLVLAGHG